MQLTHAEESDKARASNAIRGGAREFTTLLTGEEGAPGNFKLSFVRQTGAQRKRSRALERSKPPRHRRRRPRRSPQRRRRPRPRIRAR